MQFWQDAKVISFYTGFVTNITGALMLLPMLTALGFNEWDMVINFGIGLSISVVIGTGMMLVGRRAKETTKVAWKHGLISSALAWMLLMLLCALPYYLSGHYGSFLDATFDVMSGFTTTGLSLAVDMDHMSMSLNVWRHILTFVGGQGMVVLALSFLFKQTHGAYKIYVGEAKDVELVPSVVGTARIIWIISLAYLALGTLMYFIDGVFITGLNPVNAFFHGFFMFCSAWSTGGFAPMSQNVLFYHSFSNETLGMVFFILGSLNFGLHYAIWKGKKREVYKNIETQSFFVTAFLTSVFLVIGLQRTGLYSNAIVMFRKGIYQLLSAHTTTGFATVYARQFILDWGDYGVLIMVIAMLIGGSACSTAGGIKGLRLGIFFKALMADIKRTLLPERQVFVTKYHLFKENVLDDGVARATSLIIICYLLLFALGTLLGCYYGYSLSSSAFESASVAGNVGLSIGVTNPAMPNLLKLFYIVAMYMGRLEFMSVFALCGFVFGGARKLWQRK